MSGNGSGDGNDLAALEAKIEEMNQDMGQRFLGLKMDFDARFDKVDARFDKVDARFDKVDARFDKVDARFGSLEAMTKALCVKALNPDECRDLGVVPDPASEGLPPRKLEGE